MRMPSRHPRAELLFGSQVLPELLQVVLTSPETRFGWSDLNRVLAGANRDSLYRALGRAAELGLIKREPKGRYGVYSANTDSPLYRDVRRILSKLETRRSSGADGPESLSQLARDLQKLKVNNRNKLPAAALARILQFVDDFRSRRRTMQRQMISSKPAHTGSAVLDAYLAGVAEQLSNEAGLPAPAWVEDPDRFLPRWWIESDVPSARPTAVAQSPAAFRRRGIFVSERVLERA
jgi:hypothetical protein